MRAVLDPLPKRWRFLDRQARTCAEGQNIAPHYPNVDIRDAQRRHQTTPTYEKAGRMSDNRPRNHRDNVPQAFPPDKGLEGVRCILKCLLRDSRPIRGSSV